MIVKYIGHASALVEFNKTRILTDPNFAVLLQGLIPRHGRRPTLADVGPIDLILVSHAHMDHLQRRTLRRFPRSTLIVCSMGYTDLFKKDGFQNVHELELWKSVEVAGVKVTSVPSLHFEGRLLFDRHRRFGGFVVEELEGKKESFYFAGDTGYFEGFKKIGQRFRNLTLALLPIGCYSPERLLRRVHMNPEDALRAFEDLKAKWMVPIHWGVFRLAFDRVRMPRELLQALLRDHPLKERVRVLDLFEHATLPS